ncbi:Twinfilin-1, partial [Rhizopus stolonifer]
YKKFIETYLDTHTPAYIFVRYDEKGTGGEYKWLFLCYVPDNAKVRDKMLYASTRATLTKELGDYRFTDSVYGTEKKEFTWEGYKKHLAHKAAEAPLTRREQELAEIKAAEAKAVSDYQGTTTRKSYAPGVAFPLTDKAVEALKELTKDRQERSFNFVSLYLENEKIDLDNQDQVSIDQLCKAIRQDAPRFTFYVYENGSTESLVFVYTCPSTSKIRERMLYSSSKANVITAAENEVSLKFETSDLEDLTQAYFDEELNQTTSGSAPSTPTGSIVGDRIQMLGGTQQGFKRPMAPGRRRPGTTTSNASF